MLPNASFPILRNSGVRIPDFGNRKPELGSGRIAIAQASPPAAEIRIPDFISAKKLRIL